MFLNHSSSGGTSARAWKRAAVSARYSGVRRAGTVVVIAVSVGGILALVGCWKIGPIPAISTDDKIHYRGLGGEENLRVLRITLHFVPVLPGILFSQEKCWVNY